MARLAFDCDLINELMILKLSSDSESDQVAGGILPLQTELNLQSTPKGHMDKKGRHCRFSDTLLKEHSHLFSMEKHNLLLILFFLFRHIWQN